MLELDRLKFYTSAVLLVFLSATYTLLIQGSKAKDNTFKYSAIVFLLFTAGFKTVIAAILYVVVGNTPEEEENDGLSDDEPWWKEQIRYMISAILYAVNDYLVFVVMSYFDNVSYSVLATVKIVFVAALTRLVLRRKLKPFQYLSLVILSTGIILNQYSFCEKKPSPFNNQKPEPSKAEGYWVVLLAELVGACAGILNEYVMKRQPSQSLHLQNFNLYFGTVIILIPTAMIADWGSISSGKLFHDFSATVFWMLPVNALRGISVSYVYRHSTNLTKIFVISCATLLNGVLGDVLFNIKLTMQFFLSLVIISSALTMYASQKSVVVGSIEEQEEQAGVGPRPKHSEYEMVAPLAKHSEYDMEDVSLVNDPEAV